MIASTGPIRQNLPNNYTAQQNYQQSVPIQNQANNQALLQQQQAFQQQLAQIQQAIGAAGQSPLSPQQGMSAVGITDFQDLIAQANAAMAGQQEGELKKYKDYIANNMGAGTPSGQLIKDFMLGQGAQQNANAVNMFGQVFSPTYGAANSAFQQQQAGLMGAVPSVGSFYQQNMPNIGSMSNFAGQQQSTGSDSQNPWTGGYAGSYSNPLGGNPLYDNLMNNYAQQQGYGASKKTGVSSAGAPSTRQAYDSWQGKMSQIGLPNTGRKPLGQGFLPQGQATNPFLGRRAFA